jgi:hypothetical protein
MNFEDDIHIDESALDVEWLRQPALMAQYCQHAAHAKAVMDRAKEKLDVVEAEMDRDIRDFPERYNLSKLTETLVKSTVLLTQERQIAAQACIDTKYEYDMAQAAVRAMDQKKTALENLVKLHGMSYFAGPAVPRDLSAEFQASVKSFEQKAVQSKSNAKVKMQRRTK